MKGKQAIGDGKRRIPQPLVLVLRPPSAAVQHQHIPDFKAFPSRLASWRAGGLGVLSVSSLFTDRPGYCDMAPKHLRISSRKETWSLELK